MTTNRRSVASSPMLTREAVRRLVLAWLLTAVIDGLFSSVLSAQFYGSTVTQLWQRVASVLLGAKAFEGGRSSAMLGILMHFGVALGWSTAFLVLFTRLRRVRSAVASSHGILKVAALYGPFIWLMMSLAIIPLLTQRPPTINYRWWVQLFGHIPFVALPIVASIGRRWTPAAEAA